LHEKATRSSSLQLSQRTRANPCANRHENTVRHQRVEVRCHLQRRAEELDERHGPDLPGEQPEDVDATVALMEKLAALGARVHGHTFMPLPGRPGPEDNHVPQIPGTRCAV
jgi:hypothetical protein